MKMPVFNFIRGCLCFVLVALNLLCHAILILILGGFIWLITGCRGLSKFGLRVVSPLQTSWAFCNLCILNLSLSRKWDIQGHAPLSRKKWYLIVSNHQSWMDILVLSGVFSLKIPPFKFFMKKELLWSLPLAGWCCYLIGCPFMQRHTPADIRRNPALKGKDIQTTKHACNLFKRVPATITNFLEGTRFTQAKHDQQESQYKNLLKPKAGGTAIVMNEMCQELDGILNVTINYDADSISLLNLLSGNVRKVSLHYELLPIERGLIGDYYGDRTYRSFIQRWFNQLWERKDKLLTELKSHDE